MTNKHLTRRLAERDDELSLLEDVVGDARMATIWQLVAAEVRQVVPAATGVRLVGERAKDGVRLDLLGVLVDGREVPVDGDCFDGLEEAVSQPLRYVARHEAPELLLGVRDHELPNLANLPGDGLLLTLPLLDQGQQLRIYAPDPDEGDLSRMLVLDAFGVVLHVRRLDATDLKVQVDTGQSSPPLAGVTHLAVGVQHRRERRYRL
jgi:hypothetical protein